MKVLVVEDEERLADTLAKGLRRNGFAVDVAYDGASGWERIAEGSYDVVVLDRDLPVVHGDEVCTRTVAQRPDTRVLMLTASSSTEDLVVGLGLGADDYLGKPFAFDELLARIHALGRRQSVSSAPVLTWGDVAMEPARHVVVRAGKTIKLTSREYGVLEHLLRAGGSVVSAEELLERVWDEHADPFTASVRVIVSRVRSKLGGPPLIETVTGRGYRLAELPESV